MVEENIGAARRVGARVIADHRVETEGGLDRLALEPAVEHRARRLGEQLEHIALPFEAEGGETPSLPRAVEQRAQPLPAVRRHAQREIAAPFGAMVYRVIIGGQQPVIPRAALAEPGLFSPAPPPAL